MNTLLQKNILMDSLTKEEILIKTLIEEINNVEKKISEINNKENKSQNGLYQKNPKLIELKDLQELLNKKIISLNNDFQKEFELKRQEIIIQKNQINDLDIILNEYQKEIESLNKKEIKYPLLKYKFENINNKILSPKQINEINIKNENEAENDKVKDLMREIEVYKASESVLLNNQKELKNNIDKLNENLKMLKEEKFGINDELLDIISYKETLECINKNNLVNLTKLLKQNNSIISNENLKIGLEKINRIEKPIKIFNFELMIIDLKKVSSKLYEELSYSFGFILINNKIIRKNNYYTRSQNKEIRTIEIYDKGLNDNNNNNYKNKSLNNSYIINSQYENNILDKNYFELSIEEELNSYFKENNEQEINDLLDKIALIIIEQLKKNEIEIPLYFNDNLISYLSYFFKILYYDKVIDNKIKFINKDYKSIKKEYKKAKDFSNNELLKLENKYEEIITKEKECENNLKNIKKDESINLNEIEKEYIQYCSKINYIMKQKDDINKNIINLENDINNKKIEKNNEIEIINNELKNMQKEINEINNTNELNTLKNNESIINYRKIIADKFNLIKELLQSYKEKYGSNISLYNKFINNINNTLQKTRNQIISNGAEDYNESNIINLNISQINDNNILNKKIYKNNSFNKSINNKKKIMNDLELSKNWSKILNKTANNIKQVSTPSDKNISSNEFILNYGNKNYNYINSIKIEKTNYSFNKYSSSTIPNNANKRKKKIVEKKKSNSRVKNNFEIFNKNEFNINNFISKKDENSKTFSHSFFRKQNKIRETKTDTEKKLIKTKTSNGILNMNLFKNKIPKGKPNINNKLNKLLPLTKITFCYFREINQNPEKNSKTKYNPLNNISSRELCQYPYNFIKSTISLSKNYKKIRVVPSSQLEPIDFEIISIENTVVSTGIKALIDIYRNYFKWKLSNKKNLDEFVFEQINKYNNFSKEDIQKCINNKNFNFSLILKNNKRFEFIICSYDEFKMWINGMAFIIKNKDEIFKIVNDNKE